MSRLCLGTLFTAIKKCAPESGFVQKDVFRDFFSTIYHEQEHDESLIGHIVRGDRNPRLELLDLIKNIDPSRYHEIADCMDIVTQKLDPNKTDLLVKILEKIVKEDETIKDETVVDVINETTKNDFPGDYKGLSSLLAGLFIYSIKNTDNKEKVDFVKEMDDQFIAGIMAEMRHDEVSVATIVESADSSEKAELIARKFLLKHENERELIPLCHIAYTYNPNHNHNREMYTEYNKYSQNTHKYILEQCNAESLLELDQSGEANQFSSDLLKWNLSSKQHLYLFGQYMERAVTLYSKSKISEYETESFIRLLKPEPNLHLYVSEYTDLFHYIADYLWIQKKNPYTDIPAPMDYLWSVKDLASCQEELTFWLCRFTIDACRNLYSLIQEGGFPHVDVADNYAETQEDLFYCALLALYNLNLCHNNKSNALS